MSSRSKIVLLIFVMLIAMIAPFQPAAAQGPVVKAVLFYSPTCPVCHEIMGEFLPPLIETHGEQLQILNVDVTTLAGQMLYQKAQEVFQIPDNRVGVPTLIAGSTVMVGRYEIPDYFPTVLNTGLATDGLDWPTIPGLADELAANTFMYFGEEGSFGYEVTMWERFSQDPVANSIAVLVLVGMLYSLFSVLTLYNRGGRKISIPEFPEWLIPALAVVGLGVAAYLSFVEVSHADAFCGPVGECNAVQQSDYARLFGVIPVGILGVAGYVVILGAWAVQKFGQEGNGRQALMLMWWIALGGTIFSIYLTYLEPFVIGATCIWCIASAIAMTALLWLITFKTIGLQSRSRRMGRRA